MKNRLKDLRADREWSQAELAARLGVSRQSVNAIETGKYDPSLPLAFKIGHLFQLPLEYIFKHEEELAEEKKMHAEALQKLMDEIKNQSS
jgi:putative transcriptional regulator